MRRICQSVRVLCQNIIEAKTTNYVFMLLKVRQTRRGSNSHTLNAHLRSWHEKNHPSSVKIQADNHIPQQISLLASGSAERLGHPSSKSGRGNNSQSRKNLPMDCGLGNFSPSFPRLKGPPPKRQWEACCEQMIYLSSASTPTRLQVISETETDPMVPNILYFCKVLRCSASLFKKTGTFLYSNRNPKSQKHIITTEMCKIHLKNTVKEIFQIGHLSINNFPN